VGCSDFRKNFISGFGDNKKEDQGLEQLMCSTTFRLVWAFLPLACNMMVSLCILVLLGLGDCSVANRDITHKYGVLSWNIGYCK